MVVDCREVEMEGGKEDGTDPVGQIGFASAGAGRNQSLVEVGVGGGCC